MCNINLEVVIAYVYTYVNLMLVSLGSVTIMKLSNSDLKQINTQKEIATPSLLLTFPHDLFPYNSRKMSSNAVPLNWTWLYFASPPPPFSTYNTLECASDVQQTELSKYY